MSSPMDAQSSFKFDISNFLPEGHEKALKNAFYNVAAFMFVLFVVAACIAVYYVLEPFLRPLLWSVLFGSVLHPFKHSLSVVLRRWLLDLHDTGTPLAVGAMIAPFHVVDNISDRLLNFIMKYALVFISVIGVASVTFVVCSCVPDFVIAKVFRSLPLILYYISYLLEVCNGATMFVWTIVIGYLGMLTFWWTPGTKKYLSIVSPIVWFILICHLVSVAGSLRLTILLTLFALLFVGFFAELRKKSSAEAETPSESSKVVTPIEAFRSWITKSEDSEPEGLSAATAADTDITDSAISQNVQVEPCTPEKITSLRKPRRRRKVKKEEKMSNYFLYGLLWACLFAQVWLHMWLFYLLLMPTLYMGIKYIVVRFGLISFLNTEFLKIWDRWKDTLEERKDALIPAPLRGLWRLLVIGDQKVLILLEGSIDSFTSVVAILAVFIFAVIGTIFLSLQIYGESMHLVTIASSLINKTVHDTEIQQLIPDGLRDVQGAFDTMLSDAYLYARGWLTTAVQRMIDNQDNERAAALEKQILEVFDRVYDLWVSRNSNVTDTNVQHVASFKNLIDGLKTLNVELIFSFIKENIGTFMSVLDSVYTILKGNISLALSAITAILSLVFGGGTAVLNFVLNFIVFSTSLFYLLCASGDQYKPVEVFNSFFPATGSGTKFGRAVEEAINGVFAASFKMAAFYGLYTWLIHTLFDVKIIYIPSVLAAIFGAVPFLGAYWACLPAVLELWLVYGQVGKAGFMLACQIIPMSFVDSAIYSEITGGGHPYLTGLAIAGGVFCLGFEGALFGPMLLCVLFVAMHMYGSVIQPSYFGDSRRSSRMFSLKRMFTLE